ncbi:ATP-binding cassette domain-containing protein, partial [Micrococcus endophyticus]
AKARALELLERLNLGDRAGSRLEELSLGNQQRAQIAAALVHDPVALVLDEPFSGLDPNAVETTLQVLRETADTGVPVLFSSHQLDLVERLCDELVILAGGRVRASGTRDELLAAHAEPEWELHADADTGWVRGLPGIEVLHFDGGRARFRA